jgi:hypothetical protein
VKATEPVGVVEPVMVGVTVAVKVTVSLTKEDVSDEVTVVVVGVRPTGWITVPGAPVRKFESPL